MYTIHGNLTWNAPLGDCVITVIITTLFTILRVGRYYLLWHILKIFKEKQFLNSHNSYNYYYWITKEIEVERLTNLLKSPESWNRIKNKECRTTIHLRAVHGCHFPQPSPRILSKFPSLFIILCVSQWISVYQLYFQQSIWDTLKLQTLLTLKYLSHQFQLK